MKKVGMFLESDFPPDPRVENEALTLIDAGHEIHLFCLSYKSSVKKKENFNGINIHYYPVGKLIYKLSALAYTFPFYKWLITPMLREFIAEIRPNILHIHDMLLAETVMKSNDKSIPVVLDLHENRPEIMRFYNHTNKFPGKYLINLDYWDTKQFELIENANYTITVTDEAAKYYAQKTGLNNERFIVVPNTTDIKRFISHPIEEKVTKRFNDSFNILYVGDTGLRRGLMTAIEAIPDLKEFIPTVKLVIVGTSSADEVLKNRVKELNVCEFVDFEGWQDFSLLRSYMEASDICINPLHRNLHHDTTFANKIFQYMAVGRPQVVSDCPPQARVVEDLGAGMVHKSKDTHQFSACIRELYENAELRSQMGKRANSASSKWDWTKTSVKLMELYDKLG